MRVALVGAAYQGRSVIASAQRCVNLFAESNAGDPQSPTPVTYYPTPGTELYSNANFLRAVRCTYRTSIGTAYVVIGPNVYFLTVNQTLILVGFIADRTSQVYMADNGLAVVLVDGIGGYAIDMVTNTFGQIIDPSFYGADFVVFLDTFFCFNRPDTNQFYISLSMSNFGMLTSTAIETGTRVNGTLYTTGVYTDVELTGGAGTGAIADITVSGGGVTVVTITDPGYNYLVGDILSALAADIGGTGSGFTYTITATASAFDPLDIAAKSGNADPIVAIATVHRELWLIGELTTEVWIGTGAADFYFQQQQGAFINHGCAAPYSVVDQDVAIFWLMRDRQGDGIVVKGVGYELSEISTPRMVEEFKKYETMDDAIGFSFQIQDHSFYALVFPTASKGWLYELKTGQWSEWNWIDVNGNLLRPRANCAMFVYGKNVVGDWENGRLLSLEYNKYTDVDDNPITRIRTFPHLLDVTFEKQSASMSGKMVFYNVLVADMETGTVDPDDETEYFVSLRWSDNKGVSYGNPVMQTIGAGGDFGKQVNYPRLGKARDRIFELSWSYPYNSALNSVFIDLDAADQ